MVGLKASPGVSSLVRMGAVSQTIRFSEKLITGHPITNVVSW
jgi:hypothetical protein